MKKLKIYSAFTLALLLVLTLFAPIIPTFARDDAEAVVGIPLRSEQDLFSMSQGYKYCLTNDIKLSKPIGSISNVVIDGNGHTITLGNGVNYMIGYMSGVTLKNLEVVANIVTDGKNHVSTLSLHGGKNITVDNVVARANITINSSSSTTDVKCAFGGLLSKLDNAGIVKNSKFIGSIRVNGNLTGRLGGILGYGGTGTVIENCTTEGEIKINGGSFGEGVGGILGGLESTVYNEVKNCESAMNISVNDAKYTTYVGGIVGENQDGNTLISSCAFSGSIHAFGNNADNLGGILGANVGGRFHVIDCKSSGELGGSVKGRTGIGGILGASFDSFYKSRITNCTSSAELAIADGGTDVHCGGIAGLCSGAYSMELENCENSSDIDATANSSSSMLGGIVGSISALVDNGSPMAYRFFRCVNRGSLSGNIVGGILGGGPDINCTTSEFYIENCANLGEISAISFAGGICGALGMGNSEGFSGGLIEGCQNGGNIDSGADAAGIIAYMGGRGIGEFKVASCLNRGMISTTGEEGFAAGILGRSAKEATLEKNVGLGKTVASDTSPNNAAAVCVPQDAEIADEGNMYLAGASKDYAIGTAASSLQAIAASIDSDTLPAIDTSLLEGELKRAQAIQGGQASLNEAIQQAQALLGAKDDIFTTQRAINSAAKEIDMAISEQAQTPTETTHATEANAGEQAKGCGSRLKMGFEAAIFASVAVLLLKKRKKNDIFGEETL